MPRPGLVTVSSTSVESNRRRRKRVGAVERVAREPRVGVDALLLVPERERLGASAEEDLRQVVGGGQ